MTRIHSVHPPPYLIMDFYVEHDDKSLTRHIAPITLRSEDRSILVFDKETRLAMEKSLIRSGEKPSDAKKIVNAWCRKIQRDLRAGRGSTR